MASISFIVGVMGNVISILMFLSPIKTIKHVVKKKSTEDFKGLPYITTLLCTGLWTFYGVLKPGGLLIVTVNGVGAAVHLVYVLIFVIYAPKNIKVKLLKLVGMLDIGFFGAVVVVTMLGFHGTIRRKIVGLISAGLTIGMYIAPLSIMRNVMKSKSVKYMPFFLSFSQFMNGAVWSTYAVLVRDYFIGIPSVTGLVLCSAQLILYMIYYKQAISQEETTLEAAAAASTDHLSNNAAMQLKILDNI